MAFETQVTFCSTCTIGIHARSQGRILLSNPLSARLHTSVSNPPGSKKLGSLLGSRPCGGGHCQGRPPGPDCRRSRLATYVWDVVKQGGVAPNTVQTGQKEAFWDNFKTTATSDRDTKKPLESQGNQGFSLIGPAGFEPTTSTTPR